MSAFYDPLWLAIADGVPVIVTTRGFTFLGESRRDVSDPGPRKGVSDSGLRKDV